MQVLELTLAKSLPNSHRIVPSAGGEAGIGNAARRGALPEVHLLQVPVLRPHACHKPSALQTKSRAAVAAVDFACRDPPDQPRSSCSTPCAHPVHTLRTPCAHPASQHKQGMQSSCSA